MADENDTSTQQRIEAAIADPGLFAALSPGERDRANAQIDRAIRERAETVSFADKLLARGQTVVVSDEHGRMVQQEPDGTSTVIG